LPSPRLVAISWHAELR